MKAVLATWLSQLAASETEVNQDLIPIATIGEECIHFVGIGGIGMSGIARVLLRQGHRVTGSDLNPGEVTCQLSNEGAEIYGQHAAENIQANITRVVVSSAVSPNNPEIVEAQRRGLPIVHRGDMLALLMNDYKGIAISGAHGKTTTSAMVALVLARNGVDPTVLVGGQVKELNGNASLGTGEYLVAEADESDGSFLKLNPYCAVITNVENDHLDFYKNMENIRRAFRNFLQQIKPEGFSVLCGEDPFLLDLASRNPGKHFIYGFQSSFDYWLTNIQSEGVQTQGDLYYQKRKLGCLRLQVPGEHNLLNACAAVIVGLRLGLSFQDAASALQDFRGVNRRFEIVGKVDGTWVVDDYAHHPTEIIATLKAAKQVGAERIIAVFQPHRFTRTQFLREEFGRAFQDADQVIVNEIYAAGEKPIAGVNGQVLVAEINKENPDFARFIATREEIVSVLLNEVRTGDLVLTMGAGHIWTVGKDLVQKLEEKRYSSERS